MRWDHPNSLGKTVEAKASNRPVKIVYLVPTDNSPQTHMNIDAVFFEAYTRWAGVYTLVIPTNANEFMTDGYEEWLKHYDPDFVYTYVDLDPAFVDKIDRLCCPIAFIKHNIYNRGDREIEWRSFLPSWDHYIQPVSSITNVQSPNGFMHFPYEDRPKEPTVFTQYRMEPTNRFLADNFGTGFDTQTVTHAISGYYRTLCLVPSDLPKHMVGGSENCTSVLEAFRAISDYKSIPISLLSTVNSEGSFHPSSIAWTSAFRLFIGFTPLDRINFWNSRHLGDHWNDRTNALMLEPSFFEDAELVKQLGQYLNKHNFLGNGNGPYQVVMHSSSMSAEELETCKVKLQPHTWSQVHVSQSLDTPAIPDERDLAKRMHHKINDTTTLKLTEDTSEIIANEPAHFMYIPPQLRGLAQGQWIVELGIQRHNNLSKYSNVIDSWILPKRKKITRAFTDRLAKPTIHGQLAVVPSTENFPFRRKAIKNPSTYEINLPSDEAFFRHLALDFFDYPSDDLRAPLPKVEFKELSVSDKGQNLRGVISLFDHLSTAFRILTNKYWRTVLAELKEDTTKPLTFNLDKFFSFIPNDRSTIQKYTRELHLDNTKTTKQYFKDSLKDTLEHLVRLNVFYQVEHWRCKYCGHTNSRSFDNMKIRNECDICATEYLASIDIEWKYELNDFVYRSLKKHAGLPVLWTLGFLQDHIHAGSFWYLPEVDLFDKYDDPDSENEIDILCILNGIFHMVEVKLSASSFINKPNEQEKFIKLVGQLRPDVAMLSFERYCVEDKDTDITRNKLDQAAETIRNQIGPWTKLEIVVAQEFSEFNDFPLEIGWYGHRMQNYR